MANTREYRIYRANKNNNGTASSWQLSYKPDKKYDQWMMFLTMAPQTGMDENDNASFDWKDSVITVKLGENDIGEIISVLEGRQLNVGGSRKSLYHASPSGGNKSIVLNANDNGGFYLKVSSQNADKTIVGPYSQIMSNGEASILLTLLRRAVETMYGW